MARSITVTGMFARPPFNPFRRIHVPQDLDAITTIWAAAKGITATVIHLLEVGRFPRLLSTIASQIPTIQT